MPQGARVCVSSTYVTTCVSVTCVSVTCVSVTCVSVTCVSVTCVSVTCVSHMCVNHMCVSVVTCVSVTCVSVTCVSVTCVSVTCVSVTCVSVWSHVCQSHVCQSHVCQCGHMCVSHMCVSHMCVSVVTCTSVWSHVSTPFTFTCYFRITTELILKGYLFRKGQMKVSVFKMYLVSILTYPDLNTLASILTSLPCQCIPTGRNVPYRTKVTFQVFRVSWPHTILIGLMLSHPQPAEGGTIGLPSPAR